MTRDLLSRKIEALRNCVGRIESKLPFRLEELESNFDLQDIIAVNLERATQVCVDIAVRILAERSGPSPTTMAESFELLAKEGVISAELAVSLRKSVGLRNMLVHEYSKIDWKIVHDVCHRHLDTFRDFAKAVLARVPG
ncbi:MAG: DUF86 domain-containing protein [Oligoflexia bacterium]|nr:DUF86 domain-containing protein [Oligoflexia bacterium]